MMTFVRHYQIVGKELESAVKAFNASVSSFDQRVVPQGRRFAEMVVGSEDDFNTPDPVESSPSDSRYGNRLAA
jgi:DNA recombination protein RmuC